MAKKSFTAHVKPYRGNDQKRIRKYNTELQQAQRITGYINARLKDEEATVFDYHTIADDLGLLKEDVRDVLLQNGGGQTAITL